MPIRIDQINALVGFPPLVKNVPPNYPDHPSPSKISLLWKYNYEELWHRFSPYTDGDNVYGVFPNKQPFIYRYPDEAQESSFNKLPPYVKTLAAQVNVPAAVDDIVRVSKFSISPSGINHNIKQFALQRQNPFDETRVYNPLSPVLAIVQSATFGIGKRPRRHIEGNILTGLLNSLTSVIGISFESGFAVPKSTTAYGRENLVLAKESIGQAKGLIRGSNAEASKTILLNKWSPSTGNVLGLKSLFNSIKATMSAFFGSSPKSSGTYRADEQTYEIMRVSKNKLDSYGKDSDTIIPLLVKYYPTKKYTINDLSIKPKYDEYSSERTKRESKLNDTTQESVQEVSENLKKVIASLKTNIIYQTLPNTYSKLLSSGNTSAIGHDYLRRTTPTSKTTPKNQYGVIAEYAAASGVPRTVDNTISQHSVRMATTFKSDALNRLGVLKNDRAISGIDQYPDYNKYKPYEDDLVAFFFYDVVNQKYIPFRATVKGLSEGNTAFWDELRFIGRADQLYSYNGFSRTLSFTFNIVISSISELLPTWQKINYMASAVKPSNYTNGTKFADGQFSRFIIPPMFMLTIGDLYKYQPTVITSINVNIPDDASWETLNEENSKQWSYLLNIIKAPSIGKNYAQLPKEVEIAVTCNLLEKERAVVGGSHFGHAPRKDNWENLPIQNRFVVGGAEFLPKITEFNSNEVVFNDNSGPDPTGRFDAGTPFNPTLERVGRTA